MNTDKQHPTLEEILKEDLAARKLRLRRKALLFAGSLFPLFIAFVWIGNAFPSLTGGLLGTSAILLLAGWLAMAFATDGLDSLPW